MKKHKQDENGENLRQELTLKIGNINGRNMTATLVWAPISDEQTARVDAEVDRLLGELSRASVKNERNCHGSSA
jgi:hypothetical protein